jgi:hypothetical protein
MNLVSLKNAFVAAAFPFAVGHTDFTPADETYTLEFHCESSTDIRTGTQDIQLQNQ